MTQLQNEASPQIALFHGLQLAPVEVAALTAANASADPEESWREALLAFRVFTIRRAREELLNQTLVNDTIIRRTLDAIWTQFSPAFRKATGPMIAEAYLRAFRAVEEGNVPVQLIYSLADEHADRVGKYFNETSTDALIQGFNTYVNRQVPQRVAIERVIDAYGLTPRQMSGFTSAAALSPMKMETAAPQTLKAKVKQYIAKSIADRLGVFKRQEAHNLDQQAQQVAWLWLVQNHRLPETAQKMWLTANDEKVCKQCGPMHRKKIAVTDKFRLPNGNELFTPGAHVNCRCEVRLQVNPFQVVQKDALSGHDLLDFNREHPRGNGGRFAPKRQGEHPQRPEVREAVAPSPAMEEMLRDVQRLREERLAEPVIEEAPAKPTLQLGAAKPQLNIGAAKPSLRVPEPTPEPVVAEPVTKPSLSITPPAPAPEPAKPSLVIGTPKPSLELHKPTLEIDYAGLVSDQAERQSAQQVHDLEEVIYRPTRRITDRYGNAATGYFVADAGHLNAHNDTAFLSDNDRIELHSQSRLTQVVARELAHELDESMIDARDSIVSDYATSYDPNSDEVVVQLNDQFMVGEDDEDQLDVYAEISISDVDGLMEEALWNKSEYGTRAQVAEAGGYRLSWYDEDGVLVREDDVSPVEVMQYLGLDPDAYRPVVYKIEEGYDSAYLEDSEMHIWKAPGTYTAVNHQYRIAHVEDRDIPYLEVTLRPQVSDQTVLQPTTYLTRREDFPPA